MLDGDGVVVVWVLVPEAPPERPPEPDPPEPDPPEPDPPAPDPFERDPPEPDPFERGVVVPGVVVVLGVVVVVGPVGVVVVVGLVDVGVVDPLGRVYETNSELGVTVTAVVVALEPVEADALDDEDAVPFWSEVS
jgi:hypothetical protein